MAEEENKPKKEEIKEKIEKEEEIIEKLAEVKAPEEVKEVAKHSVSIEGWQPKTEIGKKVKAREITQLDEILDKGKNILEVEILDILLPDIQTDLLLIGQAKGKFGGGQRRVFKQTQKKTKEGNKPKFATFAVVGNGNGFIGVGYGKSKETVPAREKALRNAKLSVFKIRRGCGSWACGCKEPHSIPFEVRGKCGSSEMVLMPAPKGSGLRVEKECQKILKLAGVDDCFSKTFGQTKTKNNLIKACIGALKQLMTTKINNESIKKLGIIEGVCAKAPEEAEVTQNE